MLSRQPLWVPVMQHSPAFAETFHKFLVNNPITSMAVTAMNIRPEETFVALEDDPRHPERKRAAMMAWALTVPPTACDVSAHDGVARMSFGFATGLCDSTNSLHVMERLLPAFDGHVSVNIQSQSLRPLACGEKIVVISEIDKMGKRLVYCKSAFYVDPPCVVTPEMQAKDGKAHTMEGLREALSLYEKAVNGTHVKAVISAKKK